MTWKELLQASTIKQLCTRYGFTPSKEYGQNYLLSPGPIEKMITAAALTKDSTVVEVGPGFGVLTMAAAEQAGRILSFEIEQHLREYWEDRMAEYPNIEIIWGNALKQFADHTADLDPGYTVLANVPYQITSALLRLFLEADPQPSQILTLVQKEVAERVCAKPGDMSLLAVSVQLYGQPRTLTVVKAGCFWPAPKVDSAVIHIRNIRKPAHADEIMALAKAGFAQKRKQLWRNVVQGTSHDKETILAAIENAGLKPTVRAQELSVEDWETLVTILNA